MNETNKSNFKLSNFTHHHFLLFYNKSAWFVCMI